MMWSMAMPLHVTGFPVGRNLLGFLPHSPQTMPHRRVAPAVGPVGGPAYRHLVLASTHRLQEKGQIRKCDAAAHDATFGVVATVYHPSGGIGEDVVSGTHVIDKSQVSRFPCLPGTPGDRFV
jgi:hypothetical protein